MRTVTDQQIIRKIELFNPHWTKGHIDADIKAYRPRAYFNIFYPLVTAKVHRAVVLMGPRRAGKTVILWQTIQKLIDEGKKPQDIVHLSLDTPILSTYSLEELLDLYLRGISRKSLRGRVVIFDEIQYLKGWDVELKTLVDRYRQTKFVTSGSAAGALKRKSIESGAGRFTNFMLPPLSFYEYLDLLELTDSLIKLTDRGDPSAEDIGQLNREFINYINYGGFPEAILNKEIQRDPGRFIRSDILDKVLLRDLPSLYGIQDTQELNRLFSSLVYQTGNELSYAGLSKSSGVAKNTIKKYIKYLEAAFLIRTVRRVDNTGKRFKRDNYFKVYLTNPSLYSAVYEPVNEGDTDILGSLVETALFSQWMHDPASMDILYYARWKGGKGEVDMVFGNKAGGIDWCVEIKWSDRDFSRTDLKNIIEFCQKNKLKKSYVTTKTKTHAKYYDDIELIFIQSSISCFIVGSEVIGCKNKFKDFS
ncbi:hypothetical protein UR09_00255 [Candidatus Nitromaritima sp. SCGC AAA799-A02]|nr:hypothetical protein UR09_00255 [Candidatus Nitromaritima sp. SCGC AAA799-A02]